MHNLTRSALYLLALGLLPNVSTAQIGNANVLDNSVGSGSGSPFDARTALDPSDPGAADFGVSELLPHQAVIIQDASAGRASLAVIDQSSVRWGPEGDRRAVIYQADGSSDVRITQSDIGLGLVAVRSLGDQRGVSVTQGNSGDERFTSPISLAGFLGTGSVQDPADFYDQNALAGNSVLISQESGTGEGNLATVMQRGEGHRLAIVQAGENEVDLSQAGTHGSIDIRQQGLSNRVSGDQYNTPVAGGIGNTMMIRQSGAANVVLAEQIELTDDYGRYATYGNELEVIQNGIGDEAVVRQNGAVYSSVKVTNSSGSRNNLVEIQQSNYDGRIEVTQSGSGAFAEIHQGLGNSYGQASVEQTVEATAYVHQTRSYADAVVQQFAPGGNAEIYQ